MPPIDKVRQFGGEIYVGGEKGELLWYQDEFGRQHTSREDDDNPIRKLSIKRRNQILFNAIMEIFGFSKGKDWVDFRKELTDEKIKELYRVVGSLWNPDTEIMDLMPKPSDKLTAFYSGTVDPRVVPLTVLGYSLYVDKIIMVSPFLNPRVMTKEYSPLISPSQYKSEVIKSVYLMMQIMPLIEADIVEMIPDPCDFDPYFRKRIYKMAEARLKGRGPNKEDLEQGTMLMRDDFSRFILNLPPESLKHQFKKALPNLSKDELENAVEYAQKKQLEDPLALLESTAPGKDGGQLQMLRTGGNLEMSLYLAQATGSFVYSEVNHRWREFQSAVFERPSEDELGPWAPVVQALDNIHLTMYLDPDPELFCLIKEKGFFEEFIYLYRRVCTSVRKIKNPDSASAEAKEIAYLINDMDMNSFFNTVEKEYEEFSRKNSEKVLQHKVKVPIHHLIPSGGLSSNSVTQILLTHGFNTPYWKATPFGAFLDLQNMVPVERGG